MKDPVVWLVLLVLAVVVGSCVALVSAYPAPTYQQRVAECGKSCVSVGADGWSLGKTGCVCVWWGKR